MADGTGRGKNHSFCAIRLRVRGNWRSVEYLIKYLGHVTQTRACKWFWRRVFPTEYKRGRLRKRNVRSPDVSFVKADRLKKTKRDFVELVPDLMVEIKSKSDRIKPLEEKIQLFLQLGSVVGLLIDPDKFILTVYRLNQAPVVLQNGDTLTLPDLLPGWEMTILELWPPEFE